LPRSVAVLRLMPILTLALLPAGCPATPSAAGPGGLVRGAAAASLRPALEEIRAAYREEHPDVELVATHGASGGFFAQLTQGAPFDLFLSADLDYPRRLAERGLADSDGVFVYARGRLAVWAPTGSPLDLEGQGLRVVADPRVQRVALANPRLAPYGRAAEAALERLGLRATLADRLVLGDSAAQAAHVAHSGAADVALLPLTLARTPALRESGRFVLVPEDLVPPLEQGGIVLAGAANADEARRLRDFLRGPRGRAILESHGYEAPPP
jgi:molybdate transport system substrate-binding protein